MKTAVVAATAILALLVVGVAATAYANQVPGLSTGSNSTSSSHTDKDNQGGNGDDQGQDRGPHNPLNLTVGETLTLSGLTGRYASATNESIRGNASGTLTVQVTQAFKEGYLLTITSGTITLDKTSYSVTGGSVEMVPSGQAGTGTGTTSSSGQFLIHLIIHSNNSTGTTSMNGRAMLDFKVGGSEYLVSFGTPHPSAPEENDSESD